ncbi:MAG TPA: alpha/beta hydrolase [Caulobacteraceae bacterium]
MSQDAPLVVIPEAPVPDHGTAEWFRGADGNRLRAASFFPEGQARGSVVVSPGRTEPIEKYFEVVEELLARGFAVVVHDWRGQGLSHRPLPDRLKGHAAGFAEYVADYRALLDHFEDRLPKPWIALGHSMGGCLTLLALAHGEARRFKAAILSAPMLGLQTGGRPKRAARALAWVMARAGRGTDYILGDPGDPYGSDFDNNIITHDKRRYLRHRAQVEANRELALGSGTWGWLDFAFSASAWLKRDPRVAAIDIPVLALGAAEEKLVDNADQRQIIARIPNGRWLEVPGSYHEILQETDEIRAVFWREFDRLVERVL